MSTPDLDTLRAERAAALADAIDLRGRIVVATTRLMAICDAEVPLSLEDAIAAVALDIQRMRTAQRGLP